jgi:glycerol-3-phosphate dehydrogenase (NAD(P)+)
MSGQRVAMLGAGSWGTALGALLARGGSEVVAWTVEPEVAAHIQAGHENPKYLPGIALPETLQATCEAAAALRGAATVVWAIPLRYLRSAAETVAAEVPPGAVCISVAKGLEPGTHLRPTEILSQLLPGRPVAALLGPSLAAEVARGVPTSVAACAGDLDLARRVQRLFHLDTVRVYANDDPVGAEYAAALKNVMAVAAGIADGLGFGDNTKGALLTRGLAEMSRLGIALGGRRETFFGLTGVGDLVTTAFSRYSRNRHVGEEVGRGRPLAAVLGEMTQIAEGVPTSRVALELARERGVEVPIIEQVVSVLFAGKAPRAALLDLLARDPRQE